MSNLLRGSVYKRKPEIQFYALHQCLASIYISGFYVFSYLCIVYAIYVLLSNKEHKYMFRAAHWIRLSD